MNPYQKAIERQEVKQFLLGQREYFRLDRNWGMHDTSAAAYDMLEYAHLFGEEKLYEQLNIDLFLNLSDQMLTVDDLLSLINYIWIYYRRKRDGDYIKSWNITEEIKTQIKKQIASKESQKEDLSDVYDKLDLLKKRFGFALDT